MIPRIGKRGHSFEGAGQYFLHDKKKETAERVAWTYTHNIPTQDAKLAMKMMAYTAINRNRLKEQAGVPMTGRKGLNQPVYTFSLAWSPEQNPEDNHMRDKVLDALELLGLKDHEAVFVAHNETAHPHVHGIVNLVNPTNGKTLRPQNDRLKLSTWAEAYEKEQKKIYCEQRVINNEKRRSGNKVKHRSVRVEQASLIQNLYNQSKDALDFQQALDNSGYTLARGDRRGFVLVDQSGKISSLSRQLKGQRAKDIKERLANLDILPNAKQLSEDRQYFYRDQYETERQKKIIDSAIDAEEKRESQKELRKANVDKESENDKFISADKSFAVEADKIREKSNRQYRQYLRREQELRAFYKRGEFQEKLDVLRKELESIKDKTLRADIKKQQDRLKQTLADIDRRMTEQNINLIDSNKADLPVQGVLKEEQDSEKEERREELRKHIKEQKKGRGNDSSLER